MARLKSKPFVKPLRIDAGMMREQLDQFASPRPCFRDGPLHHFLTDATAAAMRGDPNVLDQAARGALRAHSGHDAHSGSGSSIRSRPLPSGSSASIRTIASMCWRPARRMEMEEVAVMVVPVKIF
jgi:hypothetical protein